MHRITHVLLLSFKLSERSKRRGQNLKKKDGRRKRKRMSRYTKEDGGGLKER